MGHEFERTRADGRLLKAVRSNLLIIVTGHYPGYSRAGAVVLEQKVQHGPFEMESDGEVVYYLNSAVRTAVVQYVMEVFGVDALVVFVGPGHVLGGQVAAVVELKSGTQPEGSVLPVSRHFCVLSQAVGHESLRHVFDHGILHQVVIVLHGQGFYVFDRVQPLGRQAEVLGDREGTHHGPALLDDRIRNV